MVNFDVSLQQKKFNQTCDESPGAFVPILTERHSATWWQQEISILQHLHCPSVFWWLNVSISALIAEVNCCCANLLCVVSDFASPLVKSSTNWKTEERRRRKGNVSTRRPRQTQMGQILLPGWGGVTSVSLSRYIWTWMYSSMMRS